MIYKFLNFQRQLSTRDTRPGCQNIPKKVGYDMLVGKSLILIFINYLY